MNSDSVDLIATDPPFKKGRDFHATPDSLASGASFQDRWSWDKDVHPEWLDQIKDDHPAVWEVIDAVNAIYMKKTKKNLKEDRDKVGSDMGAFLCFMAVRLIEMHRILKPTGSIYLHCDYTAGHYLKAVMDAIFGHHQFRNDIIWRRTASHNSADKFGPIHDNILFYANSDYKHKVLFSPYLNGYVEEYFTKKDDKGRYREQEIHGSGISKKGESGKPWRGFDPTAKGRHWAIPSKLIASLGIDPNLPQHDKLNALYEMGCIDVDSDYLPKYRQYLNDSLGTPLQDIWAYQPYTKGLLRDTEDEIDKEVRWLPGRDKKERTGFATQKPIGLYCRMIEASSNHNEVVLDPFAGCATTLIAAERTGRK
ncbi:MAG: site-specific DNA-methyltransferase [Candidatus Dadabacteria bacterium]|nr:site-specific DNA-methyltransferase [Candidatus Dadabacteria bacterium]